MTAPISPQESRLAALDEGARARWLDPAETEFCAHGFEQASMNRILAAAGESKGRTYHYFADKGALFRATLARRLAAQGGLARALHAQPATEPGAYWSQLEGLGADLARTLASDARLAALVRALHREPAAQVACAQPIATLRAAIAARLAAGQAIGAVRDDLPLPLLTDVTLDLLASIDRWFAETAQDLPLDDELALSRRAFTLVRAPLLPQPPLERPHP